MVIIYTRKIEEYLNLTEKVITEIGFRFRKYSPKSVLYFNYYIMFTLYYFVIIKVAWSVGLRICSSFRIWWECPWAKSRTKERNERRRTGWHMPVQSASWVRTLAWLKWHVHPENKRSSSAAMNTISIPEFVKILLIQFYTLFSEYRK